ncbi:Glucosamine-6-phosphate isomerase [Eumeta japonica]|uniref:Glucosamine-6-phosphate isomerase n=1 Tax=Eumeta variegata TaxID=151549 RepID=A0A4C2AD93_EUMVA|nr:Glucosamine-6-phosphate isomerase [Eumeta japonica]
MRLIILENAEVVADWAAGSCAANEFAPGPGRPFVLEVADGRHASACTGASSTSTGTARSDTCGHLQYGQYANAHVDGNASDLPAECARFELLMREAGGVNLFVGGIGPTDTSPSTSPALRCARQALTVGVGTVRDAQEVMILITGAHKSLALAKAVEGVNHMWTVSAFQQHPQTLFVCDEDHAPCALRQSSILRCNAQALTKVPCGSRLGHRYATPWDNVATVWEALLYVIP